MAKFDFCFERIKKSFVAIPSLLFLFDSIQETKDLLSFEFEGLDTHQKKEND